MSTDFEKILVLDDRLNCTDKIKYQVTKGGQNVVSQSYQSISQSPSGCVFNCVIPSLETIVNREVLWTSTVTLEVYLGTARDTVASGNITHGITDQMFLVNYGVDSALAPFPLHSLCNTMSCTINNNTVTQNMQDTLPLILRMLDNEELAEWAACTPTTLDYLAQYKDGVDKMQFELGATGTAPNLRPCVYVPQASGASAETEPTSAALFSGTRSQKYISYPNNVLAFDMNRQSGSSYYHKPRGSWVINRIYGGGLDGAAREVRMSDQSVFIEYTVTEPLLLSPFTFGRPDHPGFYGISNLTFNFAFTPDASRAFRSVRWSNNSPSADLTPYASKKARISRVEGSQLTMMFLTAHPSLSLSSRNVVPYYELPVYKTVQSKTLAPRNLTIGNTTFNKPSEAGGIMSSNIQLNQVPDKLIICCRRIISKLDCTYADNYLSISNVNINFNNYAGLCSNMTQHQLWKASRASGLANLTWDEFSGAVVSVGNANVENNDESEPRTPYEGVGAYTTAGGINSQGISLIPTTGSVVVLDFGTHIQLTEDYLAPGSLGQFHLLVTVSAYNNDPIPWNANDWELVIIPMNSGVYAIERGVANLHTGLLTKSDVLEASEGQEPYTKATIHRMIGGGFLSTLKSSLGWITSKLPMVKQVLQHIPHDYAQKGAKVLEAVGYGKHSKGKLENRIM